MIATRVFASGMAAALSLSIAAPAFAATSDEVLLTQASFRTDDLCEGKTGAMRGRCIGDVLKRLKALRKEFRDALELERDEWKDAHAHLGVGAEYTKGLQEYTQSVNAKRRLFNEQQRVIEKVFFDEQKAIRTSATSTKPRGYTRQVTAGDLDAAEEKCSRYKDSSALRLCMRQQLRLIDPAATQRGAARVKPIR